MNQRARHGRTVILCLFLVLFLGVADNQVLSPLLPAIRKQLGSSSSRMGLLFTGYSLAAGLSVLLWGPISDAFGRKRGLLAGLLTFSGGSLACYFADSFQMLLAGRIITGMGASMLSLNAISYAADYFPYSRRGWAMGSILSSYFAALILGVPLGSLIGERLGWNFVFAFTALFSMLLLASTRWFLPPLPATRPESKAELILVDQWRTYSGFIKDGNKVGALFSSFCASAGTMGFLAFLGVWLHDAFGISGRKTGYIFLASGAAALLASPVAGALSDRIGKRLQFAASNLSLAALLVVLPFLSWGKPLFAAFCAISLAAAFRQGPLEALVTEVVPSESRGSFIALRNASSQMGIAVAALASGLLFEHLGYRAVCLLGALFNILAVGGIMILIKEQRL